MATATHPAGEVGIPLLWWGAIVLTILAGFATLILLVKLAVVGIAIAPAPAGYDVPDVTSGFVGFLASLGATVGSLLAAVAIATRALAARRLAPSWTSRFVALAGGLLLVTAASTALDALGYGGGHLPGPAGVAAVCFLGTLISWNVRLRRALMG